MKAYRHLLPAFALATVALQTHAADPVKIGVAVGLSGANSVIAPAVVQSSQLAVDEINAAGGILGRKIQLEIVDDASGAVGAQKAFDSLVFQKKVDAIISMETSAARNAALPIVSRGKVPYIYTSFYEGRSCNPWMHVNAWVPEQQVAPIVDYFSTTLKAKNFFLVGNGYAFGRGMLDFTKKYIVSKGGNVVGEEYLPIDGSDWTPVLSKIRSVKPDALISATAGGAPNVSLAKQLQGSGLNLPYGNLAIDEATAKSMGDVATGLYMSASYLTTIETPENQKFVAALKQRFGAELKNPNELSEPQYEAFYLYKAAVEKVGSFDRGMGKSTLLKSVMGYLPKRSGTVRLHSIDITGLASHRIARMGVAYAAQEHAIFADLSIRDNLRLGLADESKFDELFAVIDPVFPVFKSRLQQYAGTLSGGEQKMLLVARALMMRPSLILLDEITEGLQPSVIDRITEALLWERRERGTTMLLIEQNVPFALKVAQQYAVLKQGEVIDQGDSRDGGAAGRIFDHLKV